MPAQKLLTSRAIIGELYMRLTAPDTSWVNRYAMKIDSNQEIENYAWLGMAPAMRKWIGERQAKGLRENSFSLRNEPYESTLEVLTSELRRDKSGQIRLRIAELARRALTHPAKLISQLIIDAEATACYDGQYFFDTDHSEGSSGAQSNKLTHAAATGTAPTAAESRDAILEAIAAILGFKDDQGEPMNEDARSFEVMCPTAFFPAVAAACTMPVVDSNVSNLLANLPEFEIKPVTNARLTWTDKIAVFRTDAETKPFILQEEVPISVDAIVEGSELEFREKKHEYGIQWEGVAGYGFWQHACQQTFT